MQIREQILAIFALVVLALQAQAANTSAPYLEVEFKGPGTSVEICPSNGGRCKTLPLPQSIGTVNKVIPGQFILTSPISWLAISDKSAHLCAIKTASPEVLCAKVSNKMSDISISAGPFILRDATRWVFQPKKKGSHKSEAAASALVLATNRAQRYLTLAVTRPAGGNGAGTSDNAKGSRTATVGQNTVSLMSLDACYEDDGGEIECVEDDGNPDESGGGGSGDTQMPGTIPGTIPPPIVIPVPDPGPTNPDPTETPPQVIIGPPAPPSVPSNPDIPWYCSWFGVFCSAPEMPPPTQTAEERYQDMRNSCIRKCSDDELGTPPGNDGFNWDRCYINCMTSVGYPYG